MHETPDDLAFLQGLLDDSHARGGEHLRSVFTDERALPAAALAERLAGIQLLQLATVTRACAPRVAPVDGIFYRGRFHFGSSPRSLRLRNVAARPQVSASVTHGERFAVVVHGRASVIDIDSEGERGFRDCLLELYVPRYGEGWIEFARQSAFARIEPERMFSYGGAGG